MTTGSPTNPGKILVVRVGRAGDMVMITPALDALLDAFPAAEIHLLTTPDGRRVLGGRDPRLNGFHMYTRRFPRTLLVQRRLTRRIRDEAYDRIYILESKPLYRRWLGGLAPQVFALGGAVPGRHYCDLCLDLVQSSTDQPIVRNWLSLPVSDEDRAKARALLAEAGIAPGTRLVGLHPTFSGTGLPLLRDRRGARHRTWPAAAFADLARRLQRAGRDAGRPIAVVIDALPDETRFVQPVADAAGGAVTVLSAPPDFGRYKGLLSLLDVLVTPNTGPMHMAAALDTPLVALFSHWSPADCGPFMDPAHRTVLRAEETDRPDEGLAAITPEAAAAAVLGLLDKTGDRT
jgi:ADP-heptose:LPS heptosyltransferase